MTAGFKPARGVDGNPPPQGGIAVLCQYSAVPWRAETEIFTLDKFTDRRSVMQFRHIDLIGADAAGFVQTSGGTGNNVLIQILGTALDTAGYGAAQNTHRTGFCIG